MFKFLKNKLKVFEKKLEDEIEAELAQEETTPAEQEPEITKEPKTEPVETSDSTVKETDLSKEEPKEPEPAPAPQEDIKESPVEPEQIKPETLPKKPAEPQKPRRKRSSFKRQREEEQDKQLEQSIEQELNRIVQTRKTLETSAKIEKTGRTIDENKIDDLLWDLEMGLLESDVAYSVIESIKNDIKNELKHATFSRLRSQNFVENILRNAISHVLSSQEFDFLQFIESTEKPVVIMFVGVNGTGKTLSIAKMAKLLHKHGKSCVMAAGDTFRAGAIEQLTIHANNLGVKIIKHGPGSDPAAIAYDAIEHAKAKHKDVVLLDTAGRMQTNANLMDEMAKIKRVAKPNLIVFVGDALSGNDAVEQAKRFNEIVGIDGVILTKVDTDAKGGSSLSIAYTIGKPLLFIGVGQEYEDQIPFDPEWMVDNIFGSAS